MVLANRQEQEHSFDIAQLVIADEHDKRME